MFARTFGFMGLSAAVLCGASAVAAAQDPAPAPTVPANRPVKSPGNAEWVETAEAARARAAAQHQLVYYELDSASCGECVRMRSLLYPAFDFEALLVGMVPVKLPLESAEGKRLAELYSITQTPSILIATPEGRLVFLMQGFKDQREFYAHAHKSLDEYRPWARTIDAQDVPKLSAQEAYQSGRQLFARFDYAQARPRYKRASMAPDATPEIKDAALEGLAATELRLHEPTQSRKTIDQLIATTQNPERKERAELFRAQIPLSQNQPAEALALYKRFEKEHPKSKYLEQVRAFIARLEPAEPQK